MVQARPARNKPVMVKTYSLLRSSLRTELPARASEATMVGSSASATDLLAGMAAPAALEQEEAKKLLHDIADRFKFQHERLQQNSTRL